MIRQPGSIFVFDTETTGLPKFKRGGFYPPEHLSAFEGSRLVEVAYQVYNIEGNLLKEQNILVDLGVNIENSHIHGITNEMVKKEGINIIEALNIVKNEMKKCDTVVAHNIAFDEHILLSEAHRVEFDEFIEIYKSKKKRCTMEMGKVFMGSKKRPKLIELYEFIFKEPCYQVHRALSDTEFCAKCYLSM